MTILKRALNEAPTLAVIVVTILGLSESDAVVWKEAVASLSALGTWFLVRYSTDGPVTLVERERTIRRAIQAVRGNEFTSGGTDPFAFEAAGEQASQESVHAAPTLAEADELLTDSDTQFREEAVDCLVEQGYTEKVADRAVDKFLNGEELTPQEANCITQVRQSGIRLPEQRDG